MTAHTTHKTPAYDIAPRTCPVCKQTFKPCHPCQDYDTTDCKRTALRERVRAGEVARRAGVNWREWYTCIADPNRTADYSGFVGFRHRLSTWAHKRGGLVLQNEAGECVTLPDVTTRYRLPDQAEPKPEQAECRFGRIGTAHMTCVRIG